MPIPTVAQFKSLTGRSGLKRLLKTKNDLEEIFQALDVLNRTQPLSRAEIAAARALRLACIHWVMNDVPPRRASHVHVRDLMIRADERFRLANEAHPRGTRDQSPGAIPQVQPLPYLTSINRNVPVPRVGNAMHPNYRSELGPRHWGPHVEARMRNQHAAYVARGGRLSRSDWADQIFLPASEDDPSGMLLGAGHPVGDPAMVSSGVKYCSDDERASFRIDIQKGVFREVPDSPFDTTGHQTGASGYGWAIFVLGFDNVLYASSHVTNLFHHSSFFAGGPVQCGGEMCVIEGKLRYLTNKTGHYRSGPREFYRLLTFLQYHGVDLTGVMACRDTRPGAQRWHRAIDVFNAAGPDHPVPVTHTGLPPRLSAPGTPVLA